MLDENRMCLTHRVSSPLGELLLASDGAALTGLWFVGQRHFAATLALGAKPAPDLPLFALAASWLRSYFAGRRPDPATLPLAPHGTAFRQKVWRRLLDIPYGGVAGYGRIAHDLGCASARAIGGAVGHNPIAIIIPCHRVVGASGRLTGYAGGLAAKRFLLTLEGVPAFPRRVAPDRGIR